MKFVTNTMLSTTDDAQTLKPELFNNLCSGMAVGKANNIKNTRYILY